MRITFLLPGVALGGGARSTLELANHLQRRGHRVTVAYPFIPASDMAGLFDLRKQAFRCKLVMKNVRSRGRIPWFDLETSLKSPLSLKDRHLPDGDIIVASWWYNAASMDGYSETKGRKVYLIRSYETWGGPKGDVERTYTMPYNRAATSTRLKEFIEGKFGVPVYGPIPNGLDAGLFFGADPLLKRHTPTRVGMLYRREAGKGMSDAFKALRMIIKQRPDIRIVLFGNDLKRSDRKLVRELGDPEWHSNPHGAKLIQIYDSLDVFVFPSLFEGFGNPPLEAMARGAACVTTDVGGVPDYSVDGQTALWVPAGRPDRLAEAVVSLIENEDRRRSLAEAGAQYVRHMTWDSSTEKLERFFEQILEQCSIRRGRASSRGCRPGSSPGGSPPSSRSRR